jgi:thiamine transport system permease protein
MAMPSGLGRQEQMCLFALAFFAAVIFLPPVYVLTYAFGSSFSIGADGETALLNSFAIAAAVTSVDIVFGLPVAWILSRRPRLMFRRAIDTLIDMPLVVPTAVLGISVYYFWGGGVGSLLGVEGGLVGKGPVLMALLHIAFTFPYMVRTLQAAIAQIDASHEQAATMLGASPLTVFRTVSLPLFRAGLIGGSILAFTRSLSETGASMMVAGAFSTAPTMVVALKKAGDIPSAAAVSVVLIASAVVLLVAARLLSGGFRVPVVHVWPGEERVLSRRFVGLRDAAVALFVMFAILLPTFYIVISGAGTMRWDLLIDIYHDQDIIAAIAVSFVIGLIVTAVNLLVAIPLGILVSRNMFKIGAVVDTMSDVILMVPTSALGLSLSLYWKSFGFNEFLILVLAHLSFTFPLMLKPISAALSGVDPGLEEAARTLGARQTRVFKTVVYPLIRPGIIAGVIMTFMRSLSETGATLAVSERIRTIPVLLVDLFASEKVDEKTELACILLFAISFGFIIALKAIDKGKHASHTG